MSGPLLEKQFNIIIKSFRSKLTRPARRDDAKKELEEELLHPKRPKLALTKDEECLLKVESSPAVEHFTNEYYNKGIPLIIDGQMKHWPATEKWRYQIKMST